MDLVIRGIGIPKEKEEKKVRDWDSEKYGGAMIQFWSKSINFNYTDGVDFVFLNKKSLPTD